LGREDNIPELYLYSNIGVRNKYPFPDKRIVWVEKDAYADTGWRMLDHFAVAAYHMGYYEECKSASELLLSDTYKHLVPEGHRPRIEDNLRLTKLKLQ
jgi:hypothetical protein